MFKRPFAKRLASFHKSVEPLEPRIAPAILIVSSANDSGPNSLRAAVAASSAGDEIDFDASLAGQTIALTTGEILIDHSLTIYGLGATHTLISGSDNSRIFEVAGSTTSVQIDNVTLTHGSADYGGAVLFTGLALTIDHSIITGNKVTGKGDGGGVYASTNSGTFTLTNSRVAGNIASDDGGGLYLSGTASTVTNCTIAGNQAGDTMQPAGLHAQEINLAEGGGIYLYMGPTGIHSFSISLSTLSGNTAGDNGGGIAVHNYSYTGTYADGEGFSGGNHADVGNCTISTNQAGSAGGGIFFEGTVINNSSLHAAQVAESLPVPLTVRSSTVAFNTTTGLGGTGAGIMLVGSQITLETSIFSNNTDANAAGDDVTNNNGTINSHYSLVQNPNGTPLNGTVDNTILNQDPLLGPLQNNGGDVETHAITSASPAYNKGYNIGLYTTDERGTGYGRQVGAAADIGAFEVQLADLTLIKTSPQNSYQPGDLITYTFTVNNGGGAADTNATITDTLPAHVTFVSDLAVAPGNAGWSMSNGSYVYNAGTVTPQGQQTATLTVRVDSHVPADLFSITNTAMVSGDATESDGSNNNASETDNINAFAILNVSITDDVDSTKSVAHGGQIAYTITYSNTGNRDADLVQIQDILDTNTSYRGSDVNFISEGNNTYDYAAGTVAGDSVTHTVHLYAAVGSNLSSAIGEVTNNVNIGQSWMSSAGSVIDLGEVGQTSDSVNTGIYQGIYAVAPGVSAPGHYAQPIIRVFDIHSGLELPSIRAYPRPVRDSIRVTVGDFDGDGYDDVLVSTEHGTGPVKVFSYQQGDDLATPTLHGATSIESPFSGLQPFGHGKGGFVAAGNIVNNELGLTAESQVSAQGLRFFDSPDLAFGASLGGGAVKIYDGNGDAQPKTFFPFGRNYHGGVRVAIGDVNGDRTDDLIVSEGNYGNEIKVYYSGDITSTPAEIVTNPRYHGGLNIAVGDIDGNGRAEIVAGNNRLGAPTVNIYQFDDGDYDKLGSFDAFEHNYLRGVRVALADVNHDGILDIITGVGYLGRSRMAIYDVSGFLGVGQKLTASIIGTAGPRALEAPGTGAPVFSSAPLLRIVGGRRRRDPLCAVIPGVAPGAAGDRSASSAQTVS